MNTSSEGKTILITGIQGFVGRNLVKSLKSDFVIYGLDLRQDAMEGVRYIYTWDDLPRLPEVDSVIHLAGLAHDLKQKSKWDLYFKINTGLTKVIYDWYRNHSATQFYFFSSVKAAADSAGDLPLTEEVEPSPVGPYGESKRAAEEYILANPVKDTQIQKVYVLRPAMIHGPGNKGNLNLLYKLVKTGVPWPLGAYHNERSFCSIDNVIFILQQMLRKSIDSGIYHLADDEMLSTNELVQLIAKAQGRTAWVIRFPVVLVGFVSRMGSWLHMPFNEERLRKLTETYRVSNGKIKAALQVRKLPVTAQEGIFKTIKSFIK